MIAGMTMMQFARGNISLGRIKEILDTEPDVKFNENAPTDVWVALLNLITCHLLILMAMMKP